MDDAAVVALQIERPPRSAVVVAVRCHLDLPVVIDVPPILDDGTPFPTTYWLTCPLAVLRVSRLESAGGVRDADERIASDPELREAFEEAMTRYGGQRDSLLPSEWAGPRPTGGIAGSRGGVKCLHAQYADTAAGNENPIGKEVANSIEPLDCATPCIAEEGGRPIQNAAWTEPQ